MKTGSPIPQGDPDEWVAKKTEQGLKRDAVVYIRCDKTTGAPRARKQSTNDQRTARGGAAHVKGVGT